MIKQFEEIKNMAVFRDFNQIIFYNSAEDAVFKALGVE
jgi:hypothetical protein